MSSWSPRAEDYAPIPAERRERLMRLPEFAAFPRHVGVRFEDIRADYALMRLPFRPELEQPGGVVHGGAIATLIDTVVVGTVFSTLATPPRKLLTVDMHIHYLDAVVREDLLAEGVTRRRGRTTVFLAVDVATASGALVAHGELAYRVVP
jgi:uncharacterized protein (TIGR00369 family)